MSKTPIPGSHEPGFVEPPVYQEPVPDVLRRLNPQSDNLAVYRLGECSVICAREPAGANGEVLLHLSISHRERHPSWDEIKTARYRLLPSDRCFGMLLPPPERYVNVAAHDHVFHLYEVVDPREPWKAG